MIRDWPSLKTLALNLNLPEVTVDYPPRSRKPQGIWQTLVPLVALCRWGRVQGGSGRAGDADAADPDTFFLHPHYANHDYVFVRAGRINPAWARARLLLRWRDNAPKRFLKDWDASHG